MKAFLNLFLSLLLPVAILFIVAATGYYTQDYAFEKALRAGIATGVLSGVLFTAVMAGVLLIMRKARALQYAKSNPESHIDHENDNGAIHKEFMLLMDKEMSFNVLLQSVIDQMIGEVGKGNKSKGTMSIYTPEHTIDIAVQELTKHTAQVTIRADQYSDAVKAIINYTKLKEQSFLQY